MLIISIRLVELNSGVMIDSEVPIKGIRLMSLEIADLIACRNYFFNARNFYFIYVRA